MKAIRVESYGGADQLGYGDVEKPEPRPNEALVKVEAIGVNFMDVYHRRLPKDAKSALNA